MRHTQPLSCRSNMASFRTETDSLGPVKVPAEAYWGAQTQRAVENFPISGLQMPPRFVRALALIKKAWAQINLEQGLLPDNIAAAIVQASDEVASGKIAGQFPVDVFQTGSATST